ncbi:MAG: hypothetical protein QOH75_760 [Actinomycetota bacterium]|jgi:hypothetical protein|nr:hypothetical protein [Actinomycetota bacterium]
MTHEAAELRIRQAIGGDADAAAWLATQVHVTVEPTLLVMAALVGCPPDDVRMLMDRAAAFASHREDRQMVAIAGAHLAGDYERVDALARDHLVDFPGSYLVAWVASGAHVAGTGQLPRT